jgi:hypothetical protein
MKDRPSHIKTRAETGLKEEITRDVNKEDAVALGVRDLWKLERLCVSQGASSKVFSELMKYEHVHIICFTYCTKLSI